MPLPRHGPLALLLACAASLGAAHSPPAPALPATLPATLLVRVVDSVSRLPLANAEVTAAPDRRLTDGRGEARFTWPPEGTLSVRVRQLGFRYVTRTASRGTSTTATEDTVVVDLARAAFALPQVVTIARRRCAPIDDPATLALSTSSMDLLRFGAEQFDTFRAAYPFSVTLARRTHHARRGSRRARSEETAGTTTSRAWGDPYRPGDVLQRTEEGYFIPLLFVSTLADSAFWDRHCFVARGVESRDGGRLIRLDFTPARDIREVEWEGSAWLDSAASVLKRVDFRLANLRSSRGLRRLEGFTIFATPSPYIASPDSTVAWWWGSSMPGRDADESTAEVRQVITTQEVVYVKGEPPRTE